jgi:hypothetical protein
MKETGLYACLDVGGLVFVIRLMSGTALGATDKATAVARYSGITFLETSAKDESHVDECFTAMAHTMRKPRVFSTPGPTGDPGGTGEGRRLFLSTAAE